MRLGHLHRGAGALGVGDDVGGAHVAPRGLPVSHGQQLPGQADQDFAAGHLSAGVHVVSPVSWASAASRGSAS